MAQQGFRREQPPASTTGAWLAREGARTLPLTGLGDRLALVALTVGLLAYFLGGIYRTVNAYDEGFAVYGASRVLHGAVPYRDFWAIYSPGQFYAIAGFFALFGETVLVARLWDTLARLALALAIYGVGAVLMPRRAAVVPTLLVGLWLGVPDYFGYAVFPAVALALLALGALLRGVATGQARWALVGGAAIGLATVFRHDIGAYAAASLGPAFLLAAVLAAGPGAFGRVARTVALLVGGGLAPVLPFAVYLMSQVPLDILWDDLVGFPLAVNREISYLHLPSFIPNIVPDFTSAASRADYWRLAVSPWIQFYGPLLVCAAAALASAVVLARDRAARARPLPYGLLGGGLFGAAVFNHAVSRFDWMHALPATSVACLLAAALVVHAPRPLRSRWLLAPGALVVPALGAVYVAYPVATYVDYVARYSVATCHAELPRAGCVDLYADEEAALAFVRAHTAPGERIFVGNLTHDRAFGSNILFYFLAERDSATRYHELVAGKSTTLPVQQEIVADLERHQVRYVVLSAAFEDHQEPNAAMQRSGVTYLDDYLRAHFEPVWQYSAFTVLARR